MASSWTNNSLGDADAMIGTPSPVATLVAGQATPGLPSVLAIEYPGAVAEFVLP